MEMSKEKATEFFSALYFGEHHIPSGGVKPFGPGWCVNHHGDLATFDFDALTRLVFLAHDKCVRAAVEASGPRMVKICIWQRSQRDGQIWSRHPTIEQALADWRSNGHLNEEATTKQAVA
jgi:hypothetical protein